MHAVSANQIADILHFNDNEYYQIWLVNYKQRRYNLLFNGQFIILRFYYLLLL